MISYKFNLHEHIRCSERAETLFVAFHGDVERPGTLPFPSTSISSKVLASGPEGRGLETWFHVRSAEYTGLMHIKSNKGLAFSHWCGLEVWKGKCWLRCRPSHLTTAQIYKLRPNIAIV
ncbi:hypothetical protein AVEN_13252-1 [Araneus ventricosus]|uniref:Uncharacterized protein n=1 Tax=Araneus ventricosus TaxID=182803 RepID=A0A4Y2DMF4_ARAVE|nr:hypothetical protein AVEN_13252-1 [Araneus ventricosus]